MVVTVEITEFSDMTPCSPVNLRQNLEETCCLHLSCFFADKLKCLLKISDKSALATFIQGEKKIFIDLSF
jgi:SOS-response transcriptional repressor LexA